MIEIRTAKRIVFVPSTKVLSYNIEHNSILIYTSDSNKNVMIKGDEITGIEIFNRDDLTSKNLAAALRELVGI